MNSQMDNQGIPPGGPYGQDGVATLDAPAFNAAGTQLKLEAKTVKTAYQAFNICKCLEANNNYRSLRVADMQALHDGKPPKSGTAQMDKAKSWEANASTLWLAGIVGRVSQRFVNAVISQTYCTASSLPESRKDWKTKTDFLRSRFTALVRGWDGNTGFINQVAVETSLQGYAYALFLDPYTWQPAFFRQDECYVPELSGQHARDLQFFCAKRDFRMDKYLELFSDEDAAEKVGYDIPNCLEAANKAGTKNPQDEASTTNFRKFADMIDEGSIGNAVTASGERVVKTWMMFNREYDGQVSFWLLHRETGKKLRFSFKLFRRMQDVMAMFSFEAGNGCIHSSKGLGRKLAALSIMKELFRCGIIDNARMGGMFVLPVDSAQKTKIAPVMNAPFIYLDRSAVNVKEGFQLQVSAEGLKVVDQLIDAWAEQAVGAYLAAQITDKGQTERTATEATIDARRENEASDIMIRRCLDQDSTRIQMQQLRVCSDRNIKEAKRIHQKLLDDPAADVDEIFPDDIDEANLMRFLVDALATGITEEELKTWSKSLASSFAHVTEGAVQRGVAVASQKYAGNPNIDQSQLVYSDLEGMVGAEMAKLLFIPKADETLPIEAGRAQQIETFTMASSGQPIEVSVRDNHIIHAAAVVEFLQKAMAPLLSSAAATPQIIKAAELNLNHLGAHLEYASQTDAVKTPVFKELQKSYEGFKAQFAEVVQIREQAAIGQQIATEAIRAQELVEGVSSTTTAPAPGPAPQSTTNIPGDFETAPETVPSLAGVP